MDSALISRTDIINAAAAIEPLPAAITKLVSVVSSGDYDARSIVEIVNHDPALAGDVLARANSAASAAANHIGDLTQAAARIGANAIVDIAIRRTVRGQMTGAVPAYGLDANGLWRHAVTASVASDIVRKATDKPVAPMITTAALVHDIGKLVIAQCLPPTLVSAITAAAEADDVDLAEAEREILGLDHGEVGGVVVRQWGLPVSVQISITQHHAAEAGDSFTRALALADRVSHAVQALDRAGDDGSDGDTGTSTDTGVDDSMTPLVHDPDGHAIALGIDHAKLTSIVVDTADQSSDVLSAYT